MVSRPVYVAGFLSLWFVARILFTHGKSLLGNFRVINNPLEDSALLFTVSMAGKNQLRAKSLHLHRLALMILLPEYSSSKMICVRCVLKFLRCNMAENILIDSKFKIKTTTWEWDSWGKVCNCWLCLLELNFIKGGDYSIFWPELNYTHGAIYQLF